MTRVALSSPRPPSQETGRGLPGGRGSVSLLSTFNKRCCTLRTEPGLTPLPWGEPKPSLSPQKDRREATGSAAPPVCPRVRRSWFAIHPLTVPFGGRGQVGMRTGLGTDRAGACRNPLPRRGPQITSLQPRAPGAVGGVRDNAMWPQQSHPEVARGPHSAAAGDALCPTPGPVGAAGTQRGADHAHLARGAMTQ